MDQLTLKLILIALMFGLSVICGLLPLKVSACTLVSTLLVLDN